MHKFLVFLFALTFCIFNGVEGHSSILTTAQAIYTFNNTLTTWDEAKQHCESEGATLFYPEDKNEVEQIKHFVNGIVWLGLHLKNGRYLTIDGRPNHDVYHTWITGEPLNDGIYDCVILFNSGDLIDCDCEKYYAFVCKTTRKNKTDPEQNVTRTYGMENSEHYNATENHTMTTPRRSIGDNNYMHGYARYLITTKVFYKFHAIPENWMNAKTRCELEGATLFYPENEYEAKEIIDFMPNTIWVGMQRTHNRYQTIDGRQISEVYHKWNDIYPQETAVLDCVVLYDDGLGDYGCHEKYNFICKTNYTVAHEKVHQSLQNATAACNETPENTEGENNVCKRNHEDVGSNSHIHFGNAIGDELKKFPTNKKLEVVIALMKVIQEHWSKHENECMESDSTRVRNKAESDGHHVPEYLSPTWTIVGRPAEF